MAATTTAAAGQSGAGISIWERVGAARPRDSESATMEIALGPRVGPWVLEVQDEEGARRVPLSGPIVVGAGAGADVVVRDRTVSKRHCEIAAGEDGVVVRDLGSTNGTFVGGARVVEAKGHAGTTVTIGQSTIVCVAEADGARDVEDVEPLPGLVGGSIAMRAVAAQVRRLAKLSAPVLITGETGVGKEVVARALHTEGVRAQQAFVPLNVAALPRELVESELFGHERGAFTGAVARRGGAFSDADGGTLFLDEIGELPLDAQPKLLRALDGYEVRRVGGSGSGARANVRLVAATHVDLVERVARGHFRRDLFHRLEVFVVELPPLRARRGDVVQIARCLLTQMEREIGRRELSSAAVAQLASHDWPGNVRELRNVLARAAEEARGAWLDAASIQRAMHRGGVKRAVALTHDLAQEHLQACGGNVSAAARAAGVPRTSFRKVLRGPA